MEFSRTSDTISKKEFNLLIRATEDRLFNLQQLGIAGLTAEGCLPESARCDANGNSALPGFREIMNRAIHQSIAKVENRTKLALYPRRKTNFAKTPREVYENRDKFSIGGLDSFLNTAARTYPEWQDLSTDQQSRYNSNPALYTPGSLPWDLLTGEQKDTFARGVIYVPNKVSDEERLDGRGRSYIKLYERHIIKIHKLAMELRDPAGLGLPYLNRSYSPAEYFVYPQEGAVKLFPATARLSAFGSYTTLSTTGYGMQVPHLPQIIAIDYTFGLEEIPPSLQDAVALFAAIRVFELVNIAFTKGLMSYSVQGFSASFGQGLYFPLLERYKEEAELLMQPYYAGLNLVAW